LSTGPQVGALVVTVVDVVGHVVIVVAFAAVVPFAAL